MYVVVDHQRIKETLYHTCEHCGHKIPYFVYLSKKSPSFLRCPKCKYLILEYNFKTENEKAELKKEVTDLIEKVRPEAELAIHRGSDGRDYQEYISYSCPKCYKPIPRGYRSETACDKCGTFFDWGDYPPRIVTTKSIQW